MRRLIALVCMFLMIGSAALAEERLLYIYTNVCEQCDEEGEFARRFSELTGRSTDEYDYRAVNVFTRQGADVLSEIAEEFGLDEGSLSLPLVVVGDELYMGEEEIESRLPAEQLSGTESVIYSFYVPACAGCEEIKALLDGLPEEIAVQRGEMSFTSPLRVVRVDLSAHPQLGMAMFEEYDVPDRYRKAPIIFLRDTFYSGEASIRLNLRRALAAGEAVGTGDIPMAEQGTVITWMQAVAGGLVAGLNPCALSLLMFFLMTTSRLQRRHGWCAWLFLAGKAVCYWLIGTVLLDVMQSMNSSWIPLALRMFGTALAICLITANVLDIRAIKYPGRGRIINQLPQEWRLGLQKHIAKLEMWKGPFLAAGILLISLLVASGEFLCAGQIYLLLIIEIAQSVSGHVLLISYCTAFIIPACILTLLIQLGQRSERIGAWIGGRLLLIKILSSLMMLGMLMMMWL